MTTRFICTILILFGLTVNVNGQNIMQKVEMLFDNKKNLIEKKEESTEAVEDEAPKTVEWNVKKEEDKDQGKLF